MSTQGPLPNSEPKHRVHARRVFAAVVTAGLIASVIPVAEASHTNPYIEIDGDIVDTTSAFDWATLFTSSGGVVDVGGDWVASVFGADSAVPDNTVHDGSDKDIDDVDTWQCGTDNNPQDKTEIFNAYASFFRTAGGESYLAVAAERDSTNGNANMAFWLLQNGAPCTSPADFTTPHAPGDVFIYSEFTNGGVISFINVYVWNEAATSPDNLELKFTGADCATAHVVTAPCGRVNTAEITTPWAPGNTDPIDVNAFFEAVIPLNTLFPGGVPCFATYQAETRTSQSVTATLKDYAGGNFNTCEPSLTISKTPDDAIYPLGATFDWTITITNGGPGTAENVNFSDVIQTGLTINSVTPSQGSCNTASQTVTCDLNDIPKDGVVTITINVTATTVACGAVNNRGYIDADNADLLFADGSAIIQCATLTVVKQVSNDNGGTMTAPDFTIHVKTGGVDVAGSPAAGSAVGTAYILAPGTYVVSEDLPLPSGYQFVGFNTDCDSGGSITLISGDNRVCTVRNDDIPPTITVVKTIVNDNGGTMTLADVMLLVDGFVATNNTPYETIVGDHLVSEIVGMGGYTASVWGGDCNADGTVHTDLDEHVTCTITNDDDAPSLTLVKVVDNDNGGTASASDWTLTATGPTSISGPGPTVLSGASFDQGTYALTETGGPAGYTPDSWNCVGGSQVGDDITVDLGESATCTITNRDDAPSLTLVKIVVNDNGGTATESDWTLTATGPTSISGPGPTVLSGASFDQGTYTLSESGPAGYTASDWVCVGGTQDGDQITVGLGDIATCTITNDDDAPSLTLRKIVVNDNGGTATESDWTLTATGPTSISGPGPSVSSGPSFDAGAYDLSELGVAGYTASDWVCTGTGTQTGSSIALDLGESAVCTITNDDNAPSLTLNKVVVNNDLGAEAPSAWTLTATGPTGFSGAGPSVSNGAGFDQGTYDLSESGPGGYSASDWVCVGGTQDDGDTVTLGLGESATCTITNDDIPAPPVVRFRKHVINDNGGTAVAGDFTLQLTHMSGGVPVTDPFVGDESFTQVEVEEGAFSVDEDAFAGYAKSFEGTCAGTATVNNVYECTIVNDDISPTLTVNKVLVGTGLFDLRIDGVAEATDVGDGGTTGAVDVDAGAHTVSETAGTGTTLSEYITSIGGDCNADGTITLALDEDAVCTITNTKKPRLTILKTNQTIPEAGWTFDVRTGASATEWGTIVAGPSVTDATGHIDFGLFDPGTYQICETKLGAGWHSSIEDMAGFFVPNSDDPTHDNSIVCVPITLAGGQDVLDFAVENTPPPGGGQRTIGFWKNWSSCSGGHQDPSLDWNLTAADGIWIGDLNVTTCEDGVDILSKSDLNGKKRASDAAYNMAAQLLAAKLNVQAGAASCTAANNAIADGQQLLEDIGFTGFGTYIPSKGGDPLLRAEANALAATLDAYNNGELC